MICRYDVQVGCFRIRGPTGPTSAEARVSVRRAPQHGIGVTDIRRGNRAQTHA